MSATETTRSGKAVAARRPAGPTRSVIAERGVGHLDEQQDVLRPGMSPPVALWPQPKQHDIRLRLCVRRYLDRVLRPHDCPVSHLPGQALSQARNGPGMRRPDRRHVDDLAVNELDPVVLVEDAELTHPVILVQREPPAPDVDL
jgi:hypothetical protein